MLYYVICIENSLLLLDMIKYKNIKNHVLHIKEYFYDQIICIIQSQSD